MSNNLNKISMGFHTTTTAYKLSELSSEIVGTVRKIEMILKYLNDLEQRLKDFGETLNNNDNKEVPIVR